MYVLYTHPDRRKQRPAHAPSPPPSPTHLLPQPPVPLQRPTPPCLRLLCPRLTPAAVVGRGSGQPRPTRPDPPSPPPPPPSLPPPFPHAPSAVAAVAPLPRCRRCHRRPTWGRARRGSWGGHVAAAGADGALGGGGVHPPSTHYSVGASSPPPPPPTRRLGGGDMPPPREVVGGAPCGRQRAVERAGAHAWQRQRRARHGCRPHRRSAGPVGGRRRARPLRPLR